MADGLFDNLLATGMTTLKNLLVQASTAFNGDVFFGKSARIARNLRVDGRITGDGSFLPGTIVKVPKATKSKGLIALDGSYIPKGKYPSLFSKIGIRYGSQGTSVVCSPQTMTSNTSGSITVSGSSKKNFVEAISGLTVSEIISKDVSPVTTVNTAVDNDPSNNGMHSTYEVPTFYAPCAAPLIDLSNCYKLFDNNNDTYWESDYPIATIHLGAGNSKKINGIAFRCRVYDGGIKNRTSLPAAITVFGLTSQYPNQGYGTWFIADTGFIDWFNAPFSESNGIEGTDSVPYTVTKYDWCGNPYTQTKYKVYPYSSTDKIIVIPVECDHDIDAIQILVYNYSSIAKIYEMYLFSEQDIVSDYYKVFDGDNSTYWASDPLQKPEDQYLTIDFGASPNYSVDSYKLIGSYTDHTIGHAPTAWQFYGSNDNTNWTLLQTVDSFVWETGNDIEKYCDIYDQTTNYRYYKLKILDSLSRLGTTTSTGEVIASSTGSVIVYGLELFDTTVTHYQLPKVDTEYPTSCMYTPTAAVSSGDYSGQGKAYAIDNDYMNATYWRSSQNTYAACNNGGAWIGANLGSIKPVSCIKYFANGDYGGRWCYPAACKIQKSNDGTNWTDVLVISDTSSYFVSTYEMVITFDSLVYAQYFRVLNTTLYGGGASTNMQCCNLKFYNGGEFVTCMKI